MALHKMVTHHKRTLSHIVLTKKFLAFCALICLIFTISYWKNEQKQAIDKMNTQIETCAVTFAAELEKEYRNIQQALEQISELGMPENAEETRVWNKEADFILDGYEGLEKLILLNVDLQSILSRPEPVEFPETQELFPQIDPGLEQFFLWKPVYKRGIVQGFILGSVDSSRFIESKASVFSDSLMYNITRDGKSVYSSDSWDKGQQLYSFKKAIVLPGTTILELEVTPGIALIEAEKRSAFPVLLFGFLFSGIILLAIFFAQSYSKLSTLHAKRFQDLLDSVQLVAVILNKEGALEYCNDYFLHLTGWEREAIIGKDWFSLFIAPELVSLRKLFFEAIATGNLPTQNVNQITIRTGEILWLSFNNTILYDAKGEIVGLACIAEDITDKKQAEESLLLQSAALDAAANAIIITDAKGRIEWGNPAFFAMHQDSERVLLGKVLPELQAPIEAADTRAGEIWNIIQSGQVWHGEILTEIADGVPRSIEETITPVRNKNGEISHYIAIKQDISDTKILQSDHQRLQEQLYQTQKMDSIGQLAGGIAHDFNNLLVPILGYAELGMLETEEGENPYSYFEQIQATGNRATQLTRQILAFSRQQVLELKKVDVNSLINSFMDMIVRLIQENINVKTVLSPQLFLVEADTSQIEQVILNLVLNARDAMEAGGTIIIETSNFNPSPEFAALYLDSRTAPFVKLSVVDTGTGMTMDVQQKVFDPFFTTKERGKGTGLGLSTVFGIVKQHGGNILVASEKGKGSCFTVYLPAALDAEDSVAAAAVDSPLIGGSETILVVEDEVAVLEMVTRLLVAHGYTVISASDPEMACEYFYHQETGVDLLFTDIVLPHMNGIELYTLLSKGQPSLKVLYMSGYSKSQISKREHVSLSSNFLQKPFTIAGLLDKVREVLQD